MKISPTRFLLLVLAAELLASFFVWRGTPTDWEGPPLSFWHFEGMRLRYWCGLGFAFASLWVIVRLALRRFSAQLALGLLGVVCALATEITTSLCFLRSLPSNQASYLGWHSFRTYLYEHLGSWAGFLLVGFATKYFWIRARHVQGTTRTTNG